MAINSTAVWEIRPTNGDNTFGAGFDAAIAGAGTDYSQQNTAQLSLTDLVTTGVVTTLSSVTGGFTAAMVGNAIHIESGTNFIPGFYFIVTFVTTNAVIIDRAATTGVGATGTGKVGGATKSFTAQTTTTLATSLVAGNIVWIKNEAWNEAVVLSANGATGSPILIDGYNITRNDNPTGSNRPTNDRATAAGIGISITGTNYMIKNIVVRRSGSNGMSTSQAVICINCKSDTNGGNGFGAAVAAGIYILRSCEANNNTVNGVGSTSEVYIGGSYCHDNTAVGILSTLGARNYINFTISEANAGHGISIQAGATIGIMNCTLDGNTGASTDGLNVASPLNGSVITNTIFSNNGRYGANAVDGDSIYLDYNDYFGNGTTARNNIPIGPNDVALNPQYVNEAGRNFAIGTNLKALAYPGVFPGALSTGYLDIGAVQRLESSPTSKPFIS